MIISRTPFRVSFFGGGTDYPDWFHEHGGAVLATTIDKYCYISVRELPPFFDHRFRVVYSIVENVKEVAEITHPAVRAVLQRLEVEQGPRDPPRRRPAGAFWSRFELGVHGRAAACGARAARPAYLEGSAGERGDSRRAVHAARAGRAPGPDLGGVRRLQPHPFPPGRHLRGGADDPAARTAGGAAGSPDARVHRHLAARAGRGADRNRQPEAQDGRAEGDAGDGRSRHGAAGVANRRHRRVRPAA